MSQQESRGSCFLNRNKKNPESEIPKDHVLSDDMAPATSMCKNKTNHLIPGNSHPSATAKKAIHSLNIRGETNWNLCTSDKAGFFRTRCMTRINVGLALRYVKLLLSSWKIDNEPQQKRYEVDYCIF